MQKITFYNTDGTKLTLTDTLTVTVRDSVILNRLTNGMSIILPMSYSADADTLVFHYKPQDVDKDETDTVIITKTNTPHFISLECARAMYHTITGVSNSNRIPDDIYRFAINKVEITNPQVNYDEKENLKIYFTVHQ